MILETVLLLPLYFKCGESVHPEVLHAIARTESSLNPYVIANVTDNTSYTLNSREEAIAKANELKDAGKKYSVGLMQIYSLNFDKYGMNNENAFDYCKNINTGAKIFKSCYQKSLSDFPNETTENHLENGMSCYYSGNFTRGFKKEEGLNSSYVERIRNNVASIYEVPSFYNYSRFDFKKGSVVNNEKNDGEVKEVVNLINNNWDVFNDYESKK